MFTVELTGQEAREVLQVHQSLRELLARHKRLRVNLSVLPADLTYNTPTVSDTSPSSQQILPTTHPQYQTPPRPPSRSYLQHIHSIRHLPILPADLTYNTPTVSDTSPSSQQILPTTHPQYQTPSDPPSRSYPQHTHSTRHLLPTDLTYNTPTVSDTSHLQHTHSIRHLPILPADLTYNTPTVSDTSLSSQQILPTTHPQYQTPPHDKT